MPETLMHRLHLFRRCHIILTDAGYLILPYRTVRQIWQLRWMESYHLHHNLAVSKKRHLMLSIAETVLQLYRLWNHKLFCMESKYERPGRSVLSPGLYSSCIHFCTSPQPSRLYCITTLYIVGVSCTTRQWSFFRRWARSKIKILQSIHNWHQCDHATSWIARYTSSPMTTTVSHSRLFHKASKRDFDFVP